MVCQWCRRYPQLWFKDKAVPNLSATVTGGVAHVVGTGTISLTCAKCGHDALSFGLPIDVALRVGHVAMCGGNCKLLLGIDAETYQRQHPPRNARKSHYYGARGLVFAKPSCGGFSSSVEWQGEVKAKQMDRVIHPDSPGWKQWVDYYKQELGKEDA